MDRIKEIEKLEEKATEIAANILKAIEPFLSEIKRLKAHIKELEETIKKHKAIKNLRGMTLWEGDVELYKLVEGKGGEGD